MIALVTHWRAWVAVGLVAAVVSVYYIGKRDGRSEAALRAASEISEAWKTRGIIDAEVERTSAVNNCIALGGVPELCRDQLRRLDLKPRSTRSSSTGAE